MLKSRVIIPHRRLFISWISLNHPMLLGMTDADSGLLVTSLSTSCSELFAIMALCPRNCLLELFQQHFLHCVCPNLVDMYAMNCNEVWWNTMIRYDIRWLIWWVMMIRDEMHMYMYNCLYIIFECTLIGAQYLQVKSNWNCTSPQLPQPKVQLQGVQGIVQILPEPRVLYGGCSSWKTWISVEFPCSKLGDPSKTNFNEFFHHKPFIFAYPCLWKPQMEKAMTRTLNPNTEDWTRLVIMLCRKVPQVFMAMSHSGNGNE